MIDIREISVNEAGIFWDKHIKYLLEDEIITDKEDIEYFSGREYREFLENRMVGENDRHHIAYFFENNVEIGAVQFTIMKTENISESVLYLIFGYILNLEISLKDWNVLKN